MWLQFSCSLKIHLVSRLRGQGLEGETEKKKEKEGGREAKMREGENGSKCGII